MSCGLTGHLLFLFALVLIQVHANIDCSFLSWPSFIGTVDQKRLITHPVMCNILVA